MAVNTQQPLGGTIRQSAAVVSRVVAGETVVVPVRGHVADLASIYSFNEVGTAIWSELQRGCGVDELAAVVARQFAVTAEQARQDVEKFVAELCREGLASTSEPASGNAGGAQDVQQVTR